MVDAHTLRSDLFGAFFFCTEKGFSAHQVHHSLGSQNNDHPFEVVRGHGQGSLAFVPSSCRSKNRRYWLACDCRVINSGQSRTDLAPALGSVGPYRKPELSSMFTFRLVPNLSKKRGLKASLFSHEPLTNCQFVYAAPPT